MVFGSGPGKLVGQHAHIITNSKERTKRSVSAEIECVNPGDY